MKHYPRTFTALIIVIAFIGVSCSGWLRSPSRDIYKQAQDTWDKKEYAHALQIGTKAVVTDQEQWRPKRFVAEHFDKGLEKVKQYLEQTKNPSKIEVVDNRYQTYDYLMKAYANIKKMKLPLKYKDKFKPWETEFVDYSDEKEAARKEAITVHYENSERLLGKKTRESIKKAAGIYSKAIKEYATSTEKDSLEAKAFGRLKKYGANYGNSELIMEAASAYDAYALALHFQSSEEVKKAQEKVRLHVSDLWVAKGKEQEAKNDLENLITASKSYKNALDWNEKNEKAKKLTEEVKPKIAEIYYQKGVDLQKSKDRNLVKVKTYFENATKWVPDYKDATKRFRVFEILVEMQEVQPKLDETIAEHNRFKERIGPISKSVNAAAANVGKIVAVSTRFKETNKAIRNINMALTPIKPIPYVGGVASGVSGALRGIQIPVKTGLNTFKSAKPVMKPTVKLVNKTKGSVDALVGQIASSTSILTTTKESFATAESCLMNYEREDQFDDYAAGVHFLNEGLDPVNVTLKEMNNKLDEVGTIADQMSQYTKVFNDIDEYFGTIDPLLNKVNGTAEDIMDALDKEVGAMGVTVNVKDALNSLNSYMGVVQDAVMEVVRPLMNELGVEFPSFPYMDQMDEIMATTEKYMKQMKEKADAYYAEYEKYKNYKKRIYHQKNKFKGACYGNAYYVQSAKEFGKTNKGYWDIPGYDPYYEKDQTIQVYELGEYDDRKFHIELLEDSYVRITPRHGVGLGYLDVAGGSTKNSTDIQLWDKADTPNQKFKLKEVEDGVYKIYTTKGQVICLEGKSSKNGSNVHIWEDHDVDATKWVFIDPNTKEKANIAMN